MIETMKATFSLSYGCLARQAGLSYATLMRWRRRTRGGRVPVAKRGPKKLQPLNLSELRDRIQGLDHGSKRSRGTGALHRAYNEAVSRLMPWSARFAPETAGDGGLRCVVSPGCGRIWPGQWTTAGKAKRPLTARFICTT